MPGRRRNVRYRLSAPPEGLLVVLHDIVIERRDEREVVALSEAPGRLGQELTLDLLDAGRHTSVPVRVVESAPALIEGDVRYRLRLAIQPHTDTEL